MEKVRGSRCRGAFESEASSVRKELPHRGRKESKKGKGGASFTFFLYRKFRLNTRARAHDDDRRN